MPGDRSLEARVLARLDGLSRQGLTRTLHPPAGIDLCSNDYLGLSRHPQIVARFAGAAARGGVGSTGSRLLRGERTAFAAVEARFARFKGTERALYFGAGYLANLAVLTTLTEEGDVVFSDQRNHASLIDGIRLSRARTVIVPHSDPAALSNLIERTPVTGARFIVVESLFSMDGDMAPLADYARIARDAGATLIVDEAHAVGIYGGNGSGVIEEAGLDANECISINTAGKALGVGGAFVAGPSWAIDYLIQRARPFVFSTAPPPAQADAIDASLDIIAAEPARRAAVLSKAALLRARLGVDGRSQIIAVVLGDNDKALAVAASLQQQGFDVRAIRPPSVPAGTARLRVSVNAALADADVNRFADALTAVLEEMGVCAVSS
jgi:8-amino-7-oxononanoate synthase